VAMACINGGRECDGCMRCQPDEEYECPVCGTGLFADDEVFLNSENCIVGCLCCEYDNYDGSFRAVRAEDVL
jgi:hypothetical protein